MLKIFLFSFLSIFHNVYADDYDIESSGLTKRKANSPTETRDRFVVPSSPNVYGEGLVNLTDKKNSPTAFGKYFNNYLKNYDHSGLYIFGGYSVASSITLDGSRYSSSTNTYNNVQYPIKNLGSGFYFSFGARKALLTHLFVSAEAYYHQLSVSSISNWNMNNTAYFNSNFSIDRILGLKVKLGFNIWRFTPYGVIGYGYVMANDHSYNVNSVYQLSQKNSIGSHALVYGGGLEFLLSDNIILRAEYVQYMFSYSETIPNFYDQSGTKLKEFGDTVTLGTFIFGIGFKF